MSNLGTAVQQQNFDFGATVTAPADVAEVSVAVVPSSSSTFSSASCAQLEAFETASKQGSRRARTIFIPLKEWEGTVTRLLDDAFIGSMVDLSEKERGFQDEAEFPFV